MKNLKKYTFRFLMLAFLFCASQDLSAQIIFDDDVNDGTPAPIDGFIAVGIAAGIGLALKQRRKNV